MLGFFKGKTIKTQFLGFLGGFGFFLGWREEDRVRSWFVIFSTIIN